MTASWHLKLDRAEHHLIEVKQYVAEFADKHPYRARRAPSPRKEQDIWRYVLEFTSEPDERLPIVIGDVIHNTRSALDHVLVASAPQRYRRNVAFPLFDVSPFDDDGNLLNTKAGEGWISRTRGVPAAVIDLLKSLQPYADADPETAEFCKKMGIQSKDIHALALLSRLENADKHRELVAAPHGLEHPKSDVIYRGGQVLNFEQPGFSEADTEVAKFGFDGPAPPESEVEVKLTGSVVIAIEMPHKKGVARAPDALEQIIAICREVVTIIERHIP